MNSQSTAETTSVNDFGMDQSNVTAGSQGAPGSSSGHKRKRTDFGYVDPVDFDAMEVDNFVGEPDDTEKDVENPRPSDASGSEVHTVASPFQAGNYYEKESYILLKQIQTPDYRLRATDTKHALNLRNSFRDKGYTTSSGVMSVTVTKASNQNVGGLTSQNLFTRLENMNVLKPDLFATVLDGMHRHLALQYFMQSENVPDWVNGYLRVSLILRKDGKDMTGTEILHHAATKNSTTATVKTDTLFTDFLYSVISFTIAFGRQYNISHENIVVNQLAAAMKSAHLIPNITRIGTYRRYARLGKTFANYPQTIIRINSWYEENAQDKSRLGITHINTEFFRNLNEENCAIFVEGLMEFLANNNANPPALVQKKKKKGTSRTRKAFDTKAFYDRARTVLKIVESAFNSYGKGNYVEFLKIPVPVTQSLSITVRTSIINVMKSKATFSNRRDTGVDRLKDRFEKHFAPLVNSASDMEMNLNRSAGAADLHSDVELVEDQEMSSGEQLVRGRRQQQPIENETSPQEEDSMQVSYSSQEALTDPPQEAPDQEVQHSQSEPPQQPRQQPPQQPPQQPRQQTPQPQTPQPQTPQPQTPQPQTPQPQTPQPQTPQPQTPPQETRQLRRTALPQGVPQQAPGQEDQTSTRSSAQIQRVRPIRRAAREVSYIEPDEEAIGGNSQESHAALGSQAGSNKSDEPSKFDDNMPAKLPIGVSRGYKKYNRNMYPSWTTYLQNDPDALMRHIPKNDEDIVAPALRALHMEDKHRSQLFVNAEDIIHLHRAVWNLAYMKKKEKRVSLGYETESDSESGRQWSDSYFVQSRTKLSTQGFCILEGFGDYTKIGKAKLMESSVDPDRFQNVGEHYNCTVEDMFKHYVGTFEKQRKQRNVRQNQKRWTHIINREVDIDANDEKNGMGRYSSTRKLLVEDTEQEKENVWAARKRALLDTWVGLLFASLGITNQKNKSHSWVPLSGGRLLLTSKGCHRQAPHNDFEHREFNAKDPNDSPGYFIVISGKDSFPLWVLPGSHKYLRFSNQKRKQLRDILTMEKVIIPPNSAIIGHGHFTHAGAGWEDRTVNHITIRYHSYLRPDNRPLPDLVFYAMQGALGFDDEVNTSGSTVEVNNREPVQFTEPGNLSDSEKPQPQANNSDAESEGREEDSEEELENSDAEMDIDE